MYIKIKHHDNIIKQKYESQSLQDLINIVKNKCNITKPFKLAYLDVEQDHITISSDEDLKLGIEELRETTTATGGAGQVPALTIVVVEEGEIASMPNEFSDILPKEGFFSSGPATNPNNQMQTEVLNSQPQAAEKKAAVISGNNNPAPETASNQQPPAQAQPTSSLFSNVPPAEQRPSHGQSSLFGNVPHQDSTAASRGGLFQTVATNNPQPGIFHNIAQAQQQSASLFQPAQPQQQAQTGLFSNATPAQNSGPGLFSSANNLPQFTNGLPPNTMFSAVPQFAQPIAFVGTNLASRENFCRRPLPTSTQHHGVLCDHCKVSPIIGRRYKSLQRHNFDLCGNCINRAQYLHEKFLLIQTHNPADPSLIQQNYSTVVNYFNSNLYSPYPVFTTPFPNPVIMAPVFPQTSHFLFSQLKSAFQNDNNNQINNFLWQGGYQSYSSAYHDYLRRFHYSKK